MTNNNKKVYNLEERISAGSIVPLGLWSLSAGLLQKGSTAFQDYGASGFRHKIAICKKEAKETKHWLRMLTKTNPEKLSECRVLWKEAQELTLILSSILLPKNKK